MSLRRSARVSSGSSMPRTEAESPAVPKSTSAITKRQRKSDVAINGDIEADVSTSMPTPQTPNNKRRRVANGSSAKPPPMTPTPSAIGMMTSSSVVRPTYSTGDIDDATPPPIERPAEPHHSNATLVTLGGTQLQASYSNFEEASPTRASALTTTTDLLEAACAHLTTVDPELHSLVSKHHCRVFSAAGLAEDIDPFRSLSSGIMAQQVSGAAAKSIKNKFISLFPIEQCPTGFPPPALVAQTPLTRLREAGLSQRKAEYIQGLAQKFANNELTARFLLDASDEDVFSSLIAVRGLGAWSVEMFMCFALKRMDVFSTGDLGVQRGMAAYIGKDVKKLKAKGGGKWKYMSEKEMIVTAERFRPYRSLFMWYMWRIEDVDTEAVKNN
ncbi:3-methyladenine DNA glycosylase [Oleoguttula sp. CCFEE 5521]